MKEPMSICTAILLPQLQEELAPWQERNFGGKAPEPGRAYQCLLGVVEEVGELAHAQLKHEQKIRGVDAEVFEEKAKDAIGDIVVYLADYCNAQGWDLEAIVADTWDQVRRRDWASDRETGGREDL